jgi:flagellum-specific peptidoglycan hydrolase FlgJ
MRFFISILFLFVLNISRAQNVNYFKDYNSLAKKMEQQYKIPACVILAVGYIESGGGTSKVGTKLNNHFGIVGSSKPAISGYKSRYKYFPSVEDSFIGFCELIASKKYYEKLKGTDDQTRWIKSIASGGYAADANHWAKTLNGIIKKYCLD